MLIGTNLIQDSLTNFTLLVQECPLVVYVQLGSIFGTRREAERPRSKSIPAAEIIPDG
jgi:hypothetical protein